VSAELIFFQSVEILGEEFIARFDVAALAWALDMLEAENSRPSLVGERPQIRQVLQRAG
jgi:hypothetical protein